jgi:hypothetical protein
VIIDSVKYLFDAYQLVGIAKALRIPCTQKTKKDMLAAEIAELGIKLRKIASHPSYVQAFVRLQQLWRLKLHGNTMIASNKDDPFTLTAIKDIPPNDAFAYKDERGRTWAFTASDLYYYIVSNSPTNPFTRDNIPEKDLRRLGIIMKGRPMVEFSLDSCTTIDQLYTYVLGFYEQEGFYLQNDWFKALTINDLNVIRIVVCGNNWPPIESHKDFVNLMLHMVNSTDPLRFPSICLLISTASRLIPEMEEAIPDWVFTAALGQTTETA